jgi:mono/diheme cytochrome c family protein
MSLLLFKSILSVVMALSALFAIFTMFEILARAEPRFNTALMKKLHKVNGAFFLLIFFFVSYHCLNFIISSKAELNPRGTLHSVFALTVLILFGLKILFIEVYRPFYGKVQTIGLIIALISFGVVSTSGGYYFLVSGFSKDTKFEKIMDYKKKGMDAAVPGYSGAAEKITAKTDTASIGRGKNLFDSKCIFCHNAYSTNTIVGPGLKGVLNNKELPISRKPATPENVADQLREPFSSMPSFSYLTDKEVSDIISFLNTL